MARMMKRLALAASLVLGILPGRAAPPASDLVLWYAKPAENWDEALPIGNGSLGAMRWAPTSPSRSPGEQVADHLCDELIRGKLTNMPVFGTNEVLVAASLRAPMQMHGECAWHPRGFIRTAVIDTPLQADAQ